VADLVALQMPVHRREIETGAMARPEHVEERIVVPEQDGNAVAGFEPPGTEHGDDATGPLLELSVGLPRIAVPVDDCDAIGILLRVGSEGEHRSPPRLRP